MPRDTFSDLDARWLALGCGIVAVIACAAACGLACHVAGNGVRRAWRVLGSRSW
jgi:hypothetical protein